MINWTIISLSLVVIIFYIIVLFSLFEVKLRVAGKISVAFIYFMTAVFLLIVIRILNVLSVAQIFSVPYLHEILAVIISFFLLMTAISFYNALKSVTDKNRKNKHKKKGGVKSIKYSPSKYKSLRYKSHTKSKPKISLRKRYRKIKRKLSEKPKVSNRKDEAEIHHKLEIAKKLFGTKQKKVVLAQLKKQHEKATKEKENIGRVMKSVKKETK